MQHLTIRNVSCISFFTAYIFISKIHDGNNNRADDYDGETITGTHMDGPVDTRDTSEQVLVDRSLFEQDKVKLLAPCTAGL